MIKSPIGPRTKCRGERPLVRLQYPRKALSRIASTPVDLADADAAFRDRVHREGILGSPPAATRRELAVRTAPSKIERDAAIQRFESGGVRRALGPVPAT